MGIRVRKTSLFLIFLGLVLFAGGMIFGIREYSIITQGDAIPATVVRILESEDSEGKKFFRPEFQYQIAGEVFTYRPPYRLTYSRYRTGDTTTLYVSERGAALKEINPGFIGMGLSILAGAGFLTIGIIWMVKRRRRYDSSARLKRHGKKVYARFLYEEPTIYTIDDEQGYVLYFKEEKGDRIFQSKPVFSDFTIKWLEEHIFDVYVDIKDPRNYYVDIDKHFGPPRPRRR